MFRSAQSMLKVEVVKLTHFVDTFLLKYIRDSLGSGMTRILKMLLNSSCLFLFREGGKKAQGSLE